MKKQYNKKDKLYDAIVKFEKSEKKISDYTEMLVIFLKVIRPDSGLIWPEVEEAILRAKIHAPFSEKRIFITKIDNGMYIAKQSLDTSFKISEECSSPHELIGLLMSRHNIDPYTIVIVDNFK